MPAFKFKELISTPPWTDNSQSLPIRNHQHSISTRSWCMLYFVACQPTKSVKPPVNHLRATVVLACQPEFESYIREVSFICRNVYASSCTSSFIIFDKNVHDRFDLSYNGLAHMYRVWHWWSFCQSFDSLCPQCLICCLPDFSDYHECFITFGGLMTSLKWPTRSREISRHLECYLSLKWRTPRHNTHCPLVTPYGG